MNLSLPPRELPSLAKKTEPSSIQSHPAEGGILVPGGVAFFDGRIARRRFTDPAQAIAAAFDFKRGALSGGQGVNDSAHDFCRGLHYHVDRELSDGRGG